VKVVDVFCSFISADVDEEFSMSIWGWIAKLMVETAPNIYRKYITLHSINQPVLYTRLQKALYGCLRSALLFYKKII
jgi:hypothetical protein